MSDNRDKDEKSEDLISSFMSRHFPDAKKLTQNKQVARPPAIKVGKHRQFPATEVDSDMLPPGLSADDTLGTDDDLSFQGNGVQNRLMRQLKRGQLAIEDRLDLHGQTVTQAYRSTMRFISQCQQAGLACVLIIHGQGYRSARGIPVLKQNVNLWLRQHDAVVAYQSAISQHGGKGAVYVLLRKKFNRKVD